MVRTLSLALCLGLFASASTRAENKESEIPLGLKVHISDQTQKTIDIKKMAGLRTAMKALEAKTAGNGKTKENDLGAALFQALTNSKNGPGVTLKDHPSLGLQSVVSGALPNDFRMMLKVVGTPANEILKRMVKDADSTNVGIITIEADELERYKNNQEARVFSANGKHFAILWNSKDIAKILGTETDKVNSFMQSIAAQMSLGIALGQKTTTSGAVATAERHQAGAPLSQIAEAPSVPMVHSESGNAP